MTVSASPLRLQLSRRRGFNLQALSQKTNGLPAVNCARPGKHGNPFIIGVYGTASECVEAFRHDLEIKLSAPNTGHYIRQWLDEDLRGRNLACWCPLGQPCHADVLLELANR